MPRPSSKAALRGEPSYIWRAGQERRLKMIRDHINPSGLKDPKGFKILENGCGVGMYIGKLKQFTPFVFGLEYESDRAVEAGKLNSPSLVVCGAGEHLPYPNETFDMILSNEVIEHVQDDALCIQEMVRALKPQGRIVLFCPNRWYPVEQHGIYWGKKYIFGNIPLVNYLPDALRNKLAPHVRAYTGRGLRKLFDGSPVRIVHHSIIYGGYDNLIARLGILGKLIRAALYVFENTPLQIFGLSHFMVIEKT
jgi:SAM-dependent methyltransferase